MATEERDKVGLPPRRFLYTLDQIAGMLAIETNTLMRNGYMFFQGRQPGRSKPDELVAVNIAPPDKVPDWRVEERELIRWMKRKGFRYVDR